MDIKKLVTKLKARGLDITEELAVVCVEETLDWTVEEVQASPNKYDDLLVVVIPVIKKTILAQVDKIDGQDDAGR